METATTTETTAAMPPVVFEHGETAYRRDARRGDKRYTATLVYVLCVHGPERPYHCDVVSRERQVNERARDVFALKVHAPAWSVNVSSYGTSLQRDGEKFYLSFVRQFDRPSRILGPHALEAELRTVTGKIGVGNIEAWFEKELRVAIAAEIESAAAILRREHADRFARLLAGQADTTARAKINYEGRLAALRAELDGQREIELAELLKTTRRTVAPDGTMTSGDTTLDPRVVRAGMAHARDALAERSMSPFFWTTQNLTAPEEVK